MADSDEKAKPAAGVSYPGMMGDGTEEQNLDQPGNPADRITEDEVKDAFATDPAKDGKPKP